jgi:hypothetical protein
VASVLQAHVREFAVAEGNALPPDVSEDRSVRIAEIKLLNKSLNAAQTLEDLSQAMKWTEDYVQSFDRATYYLITYDKAAKRVKVEPYFQPIEAVKAYDKAENLDVETDKDDIVLVEADKLEASKEGVPNYFNDVQLFKNNLQKVVKGAKTDAYTLVPQANAPSGPGKVIDPAWLRRRGRWK